MEFLREIAKNAWAQYDYSRRLEESLDVLKNETQELSSREADVNNELNTAKEMQGKKPKQEVSLWLEKVQKITSEVIEIEKDFRVGKDSLLSRVELGKLVIKKIEEVVKLKEKGQFSEGLLADLLPETGIMPTTKLVGRTTAERNLEKIWESLMDDEVRTIGVYGMGGVGKTTIMTHIHNRINSSRIIGTAFWVTVSNDASIERLQNGIAQAIGLNLSNEHDEMRRSMKLFVALMHKEKHVLIFDDVWNTFPLEKLGITEENACKIVLTTRSKNVCRGMMCQKKFEVQVLSREEGWQLFKEKLGAHVMLSSEVEPIAKLVTEECGGLPLGIITVAGAMREKDDVREWRNALEELKGSTMEIEGMDDKVFQILKFSYDRLKSERIQSCFLHCALFPLDQVFSDAQLIGYWLAEGLIDDMGDREKELDKVQTILNGLIDVCMLVRRLDGRVVMHDLIRDLAIGITRNGPRFVVKAGMRIRGSIGAEVFTEDVDKISLMRNEIEMLSGEPNCPKLTTLLLQGNTLSGNISDGFFNCMNSLRVLDLSDTGIEHMPESVSNLENLCALLLKNCRRLRKVPSIAKLKRLRLLDLSITCIEEVPHGMECLADLRELYVASHLWVDLDFYRYLKSGHWKCLKLVRLSSSYGNFTLETDSLVVVDCNLIGEEISSLVLPNSIVKLNMKRCDMSRLPSSSRFQECYIWRCSMKWLLPIGDNSTLTPFPSMQFLCLTELPNFRGLCEGILPPGSFSCLRRLIVRGCHVLENLMSLELFQHLHCLEQIIIGYCSEMEEVIKEEEEGMVEEEGNINNNNNTIILLPNLRYFELTSLRNLKSVCKRVLVCPSLINIAIMNCDRLKKIPLSLRNSTCSVRGYIKGSKEWWDALEWDDPNTKTLLLPLFVRGVKRRADHEVEGVLDSMSRQP